MTARKALSFSDRVEISTGLKVGWGVRRIAVAIGRDPGVVSREIRRNRAVSGVYRPVSADVRAEQRRRRPKKRKVAADPVLAARVRADLKRSRTPRQIAGRLHREATDATVATMKHSPPAQGRTASHEAIYQYIYALPKGELAKNSIFLRSGRTRRRPATRHSQRSARIVGMTSIDDRPADVADRRVPGHWEGDLIIGARGATAAATLVERTTRFVTILALPDKKDAGGLADTLITHAQEIPAMLRKSLTWDQGTEMARHAALTLATDMPVYFAHPRSPWERGSNENTNGLIREYLPKGTEITDHQPYLTAIAEELNERPRATLGYLTPREAFEKLLNQSVSLSR